MKHVPLAVTLAAFNAQSKAHLECTGHRTELDPLPLG